jgi:hypothetical protein
MRLIAFFAAIAVLFCLTDASVAQPVYAASVSPAALSDPQTPTARAAGLRMLTWPGKVNEAPRRPAASSQRRIWNPDPLPQAAAPPAPAPRVQAALPASIYAPPPPAPMQTASLQAPRAPPPQTLPPPAPVRLARASTSAMTQASSPSDGDYLPPHFYSLYREYGQKPDPIPQSEYDPKAVPVPLGPQFFASQTTDLAQPPPPVPHTVTTSGGRVMESAPPSPDDTPG